MPEKETTRDRGPVGTFLGFEPGLKRIRPPIVQTVESIPEGRPCICSSPIIDVLMTSSTLRCRELSFPSAAVKATIVDADEPSPAPPGTVELMETLMRGLKEYSM